MCCRLISESVVYWEDGRESYGESGRHSSCAVLCEWDCGVILGVKLCGDLRRLQLAPP